MSGVVLWVNCTRKYVLCKLMKYTKIYTINRYKYTKTCTIVDIIQNLWYTNKNKYGGNKDCLQIR